MNIPSTPLLNSASPLVKQPKSQDFAAPRFGSKLDEFRSKQAKLRLDLKYEQAVALLEPIDSSQALKKVGDTEIHFTTGETFKVVDFLVHLYENGQCTVPELLKSLPVNQENRDTLYDALYTLAKNECILATDYTKQKFDRENLFCLGGHSVDLLKEAYPDLQLPPEQARVYVSPRPGYSKRKPLSKLGRSEEMPSVKRFSLARFLGFS